MEILIVLKKNGLRSSRSQCETLEDDEIDARPVRFSEKQFATPLFGWLKWFWSLETQPIHCCAGLIDKIGIYVNASPVLFDRNFAKTGRNRNKS